MKNQMWSHILTGSMLCLTMIFGIAGVSETVVWAAEESQEENTEVASYVYEFEGMMGTETAQFDFYGDGSCQFSLPGNPVLKDVYAGTYEQKDSQMVVHDLKNIDESAQETTPGLWDWIVDGDCVITIDETAGTFEPEGAGQTEADIAEKASVEEVENRIAYADISESEVADVYLPDGVENAPVIILVHGGGFLFGDPTMELIQPVIEAAVERGYAVFSVDYRKSSEAVFPAALADVKAAVRYVKHHAEEYGVDAEHISVWGESAGAYLSLMTALTPDVQELNGDVTTAEEESSKVTALVSFYAPVEFYTMYQDEEEAAESFESKFLGQSILEDETVTDTTYWETYAEQLPEDLAVWIQVGDSDSRVPCTQSENFAERLAEYLDEEQIVFQEMEGADHEDPLFYTEENLSAVLDWLDGYMK